MACGFYIQNRQAGFSVQILNIHLIQHLPFLSPLPAYEIDGQQNISRDVEQQKQKRHKQHGLGQASHAHHIHAYEQRIEKRANG